MDEEIVAQAFHLKIEVVAPVHEASAVEEEGDEGGQEVFRMKQSPKQHHLIQPPHPINNQGDRLAASVHA